MTYPVTIQKLIEAFSGFPTVGLRTASRFVFYLLKKTPQEIEELTTLINNLKKNVKVCHFCLYPFEPRLNETLCPVCSNNQRNKTMLCIVEKEADLVSLERTRKYQGIYFILGSLVFPLKKSEMVKLPLAGLLQRIKEPASFDLAGANFQEIIIATGLTTEGEATSLYLERLLKPLNIKITRLGRGLPIGAELEYADEETLSSALESRK